MGCCWEMVGRVGPILPSFMETCSILYKEVGEIETLWVSVSRKLVLATKLLSVVSLLSGGCRDGCGYSREGNTLRSVLIYPSYQLFLA